MAGVAGLEPAHARIKTLCLTNLATPQNFFMNDLIFSKTALFKLVFFELAYLENSDHELRVLLTYLIQFLYQRR